MLHWSDAEPATEAERDRVRGALLAQQDEIARKGAVGCVRCERRLRPWGAYRCRQCGLYLCGGCALQHFGLEIDPGTRRVRRATG